MKRILSIVAAVFLAATVMLPIAVPVQAQTEQSLVIPADFRFGSGAPNVISVNATSSGSAIISAEYQAIFSNDSDTLVAREILAQKSLTIPSPRAGAGAVPDSTSVPVGLPPGSIVSVTVFGTVTSVNATSGEWQIGTPPIFVYESLNTSIQGTPGLGTNVRVEAVRTLTPGPVVANKITQLAGAGGSLPSPPPTMDMMFLFNGTLESVQSAERSSGIQLGAETWTADNVIFRIDDSNSPASIDPGIGLGAGLNPVVTVLFTTPSPSDVSANIALEIHAENLAGLDQVPPVLHPNPTLNTIAAPVQVPTGSWMQFDIDGVVTSVNATSGEWQIGTPPVIVYEGKTNDENGLPISATVFGGARRPVQGDEVRVVATRDLMPGPLVAKQIVFLTGGPLPASAPVIDSFFRFNGSVQTMGADIWTVANIDFVVNNPLSPAVIEAGLAVGDNVTANFNFIGPPPPESALWASLTLDSATDLHTGVLTPPAVSDDQSGLLFLRTTDAQQQVTTTMVPATLLAVPAAVPTAPGNLSAAAVSATRVNLTWTDTSDDEASFRIERATDASFTLNVQNFIVAANSEGFSDITAPVNTALYYRIFAVNGAGTSMSGIASALPPAAPGNLSATVISQSRIDLGWNHNSADETGFRVERAAGSSGFSIIASLPPDTFSYSDLNVPVGVPLNYRIFAFNLRGDSAMAGPIQELVIPIADSTGNSGSGGGGLTITVGMAGLTGDAELKVDNSGKSQNRVRLSNSGPGKPSLEISSGTTMKTVTGAPVTSITLSVPDTMPPVPPDKALILAQDFGPNGATFDIPITLTMTFDPASLPAGVTPPDLILGFFDGTKWVTLDTTLDATNNSLSAKVSHFTVFGIMAKLPPISPLASSSALTLSPTPASASTAVPTSEPATTATPTPASAPEPSDAPALAATPEPTEALTSTVNSSVIIGIIGVAVVLIGLVVIYGRRRLTNR